MMSSLTGCGFSGVWPLLGRASLRRAGIPEHARNLGELGVLVAWAAVKLSADAMVRAHRRGQCGSDSPPSQPFCGVLVR